MSYRNSPSYQLHILLYGYFYDLQKMIPYIFYVCVTVVLFSLVIRRCNKKKSIYLASTILVVLISILFAGTVNMVKFLVPAIIFVPVCLSVFKQINVENKSEGTLVLIACFISLTQVAGSNTGLVLKLATGFLFLVPLIVLVMWKEKKSTLFDINIYWRPILVNAAIIIILLSGIIRFAHIYHVGDGLIRFQAIHPIDHKYLKGILTTHPRAVYIESLTGSIKSNIKDYNSLFIYGQEPLFYYLCDEPPAVYPFWMINNVQIPERLFQKLEDAVIEEKRIPMIVVTDSQILGAQSEALLKQFLKKYNYECVETKYNYQIWNKWQWNRERENR